MEGYKIDFETPEGQQVPHWDEASNIKYDNSNAPIELDNVQVETIQEAIEALKAELGDVELPNITIDANGNWVIGDTNTNTSVRGVFKFARSNSETTMPQANSFKTTQTLPDKNNQFMWFRVDYTQNGTLKTGTPYILMKYQAGGNTVVEGGYNIEIVTDTQATTNTPNTLYFFT